MVAESAADILSSGKVGEPTKFYVDEWKTDIFIADPSAAVIDWVQEYIGNLPLDEEGKPRFSQRSAVEIAIRMLCNSKNELLFSPEDIDKIMETTKPAGWLQVLEHCSTFFVIDSKTLDEATKN